jgi:hypothetical protein
MTPGIVPTVSRMRLNEKVETEQLSAVIHRLAVDAEVAGK